LPGASCDTVLILLVGSDVRLSTLLAGLPIVGCQLPRSLPVSTGVRFMMLSDI
jgi:hypothetical protein